MSVLPRSLDAIHLATALHIRERLTAFVAYDNRLAEAARATGLPGRDPRQRGG
jgi:predicted nucleic acid-binding protein